MSAIILRNGLLASIVLLVGASLPFLMGGYERFSYAVMGYITYAVLFAALSFVVIGIRQYKAFKGGRIRMNDGLKVGMLTVLIPAICFFVYTAIFMANYGEVVLNSITQHYQNTLPAKEWEQFQKELTENKELALSPWLQGGQMFVTVFGLGFVVAAIAAWWHSRAPR